MTKSKHAFHRENSSSSRSPVPLSGSLSVTAYQRWHLSCPLAAFTVACSEHNQRVSAVATSSRITPSSPLDNGLTLKALDGTNTEVFHGSYLLSFMARERNRIDSVNNKSPW